MRGTKKVRSRNHFAGAGRSSATEPHVTLSQTYSTLTGTQVLQANPSWIVVETDLSSAFQRAAREDIMHELFDNSELRAFIPMFISLYGSSSKLFFEDVCELMSEEGSQQGCPLGGLLFILMGLRGM